mmetsp:Transcript_98985/g.288675  ORF Transcript_98985/g.288675 Transcript_98985/m.288675 type:complete len:251 (-) Transcript_98985:37-789(-)
MRVLREQVHDDAHAAEDPLQLQQVDMRLSGVEQHERRVTPSNQNKDPAMVQNLEHARGAGVEEERVIERRGQEHEEQAEAEEGAAPDVVNRPVRDLVQQKHGTQDGQQEHETVGDCVPQLLSLKVPHDLYVHHVIHLLRLYAAVHSTPPDQAHHLLRAIKSDGTVGGVDESQPAPPLLQARDHEVHEQPAALISKKVALQDELAKGVVPLEAMKEVRHAGVVDAGGLKIQLLDRRVHGQQVAKDARIGVS